MAKPIVHAASSAKKFGGVPGDYFDCHQFLDSTKQAHATLRHRTVFHSVEGVQLVAAVLGPTVGNGVPTADVAAQHVEEDLGRIPKLSEYIAELKPVDWMTRSVKKTEWHALEDARRYGGKPEDYVHVHTFVDSVVGEGVDPALARIVLHHAFGAFVVERKLGLCFTNSAGKTVHVRDLVEKHIHRELGRIPDLGEWLATMRLTPWMGGVRVVSQTAD